MPEGHLEVELLRAHKLKDVEAFGKSDPYAVLTCGSAKFESKVLQDAGGNPVWNETFLMETKTDNAPELLIALFDKEKKGKDEPMGTVRVPLATAYSQKQVAPTKYKVQLKNGKFHGEVELGMKFFPKLSRKGTLQVKLVEGHNLLASDVASKSDPYAVIKCDTQQHKSHVMKNAGSNPVWNESFVFDMNGNNVNDLHVSLFDKDTFSKDDPLGQATIPLHRVFMTGQVAPTPYRVIGNAGQPQGDIVVGLTFNPKA